MNQLFYYEILSENYLLKKLFLSKIDSYFSKFIKKISINSATKILKNSFAILFIYKLSIKNNLQLQIQLDF